MPCVEVAVWSESEVACSKQIVEFDFPIFVCDKHELFLKAVNYYLVDKEYIEDRPDDFLNNLELSEVKSITTSRDVIYECYIFDESTNEYTHIHS
ncbi:hypothetical protein [Candidatus Symbiopectobacterium sp. NZEC135]|uniref:hypothetical protein n=1 Tax=Candidatus Symbiopectobacterium sp. NZEC135 TaxID=2820471 RepID=UPI002225E780|nr:hypothetical protein [Candidatus Symbiopectobacterium sp. NZEC135]MCW2478066.1 hypothetical protein [Candidatus Symbiopectobacterium sp. NZEC135]